MPKSLRRRRMADKGQTKWRWNNTKLILMFSLISKSCLSFFYIKKVFLKYQFIQQIHDTYIKGSLMLCRTKIFPGAGFSWLRLWKSIWTALLAQWPTVLAPRFLPPRTMTLILWEWGCKSLTFLAQCFSPSILLWQIWQSWVLRLLLHLLVPKSTAGMSLFFLFLHV